MNWLEVGSLAQYLPSLCLVKLASMVLRPEATVSLLGGDGKGCEGGV